MSTITTVPKTTGHELGPRFATAVECSRRVGAWALGVRDHSEHAKVLLARARARAERRAAALLDDAPRLSHDVPIAAAGAQRPVSEASFRREGEYWTIAYAGAVFHLRDVKGLRYIAFLLAGAGQELHALELARAAGGASGAVVQPSSQATAGVVLDAEAKEAYRRRLQELGEDLEEARDWNDPERVARIEAEIDALTTELARAAGFGGRDRHFASPAERARVSVTKAIRSAIKAIDRQSPALGAHLADSVRTGRFCSYAPPGEAPPRWAL